MHSGELVFSDVRPFFQLWYAGCRGNLLSNQHPTDVHPLPTKTTIIRRVISIYHFLQNCVLRFLYGIEMMIRLTLLTHWGRVMQICISKISIIGSDNGLSTGQCKAIIWNNNGILLIGPLGTNFREVLIKLYIFSFKKMHLKMSSGNWQPFCLCLNVLWLGYQCVLNIQQSYAEVISCHLFGIIQTYYHDLPSTASQGIYFNKIFHEKQIYSHSNSCTVRPYCIVLSITNRILYRTWQ